MSYNVADLLREQEAQIARWNAVWLALQEGKPTAGIVYEGCVTGLSHHQYIKYQKYIDTQTQLVVKPDPDNKYDPNATGIWFKTENDVIQQIGWVPKALNGPISKAWRKGFCFRVIVMDHRPQALDSQKRLHVRIVASKALTDSNKNMYHFASGDANPVPSKLDEIRYDILTQAQSPTHEEPIMATKSLNAIVEQNISLGTSAAFLEAGRIANNQLSSIASKKLPIMVRAYADTAVGRLLLANIALMAKDHFRPNDERLGKLVNAMTVSAYQEVLQHFDVEQMIDDMISNNTIKRALAKFDEVEEPTTKKRAAKAE